MASDRILTAEQVVEHVVARGDRMVLARSHENLRTERDWLHTWEGLMALLDEHYPADIFVGGEGADPGPQIVALIRQINELREGKS